MSKMKNILYTIAICICITNVSAQQLPLYSQYTQIPLLYNPAYAGIDTMINASLVHRSQWKGIPGAPVTSAVVIDGPVRVKNLGIGGLIYNDVTDITSQIGAYSIYSYKVKLKEEHHLFFGLSLGVLSNRIDLTKAVVNDANDPFITSNSFQRTTTFDGNFGVNYIWKGLHAGLSVPHLFGNKMQYVNTQASSYYRLSRHYMLSLKYTFDINKEKGMKIYPLVMLRYAKGAPFQFDVNAIFDWEKYGWLGVSYRHGYAVGVNLGIHLKNNIKAGYTYDIAINRISKYIGGAHELFIGYTFGRKN